MNQIHPSQFVLAWWGSARQFRKLELMHRSWQIHTAHQTVGADAWLQNSLSDNSLVAMRSAIIPFFCLSKKLPLILFSHLWLSQGWLCTVLHNRPNETPTIFHQAFLFYYLSFRAAPVPDLRGVLLCFSPLHIPLFWRVLSQFMQSTFVSLFIYLLVQSGAQLQTLQGKGTKTHTYIYFWKSALPICVWSRMSKKLCFVFMKSDSSVSKPDWWEDKGVRGAASIIAICIEYKTVV